MKLTISTDKFERFLKDAKAFGFTDDELNEIIGNAVLESNKRLFFFRGSNDEISIDSYIDFSLIEKSACRNVCYDDPSMGPHDFGDECEVAK